MPGKLSQYEQVLRAGLYYVLGPAPFRASGSDFESDTNDINKPPPKSMRKSAVSTAHTNQTNLQTQVAENCF